MNTFLFLILFLLLSLLTSFFFYNKKNKKGIQLNKVDSSSSPITIRRNNFVENITTSFCNPSFTPRKHTRETYRSQQRKAKQRKKQR